MINLRGITWDHVRGIAPLKAVSQEYQEKHTGISIEWDARSLKDFEDYPIEKLCESYDLIMLDHPCMGTGFKKQVLVPLDEWMPKEFLLDQGRNTVGPSYESYTWENHQWALALDAASQVSAYRPDLLSKYNRDVPKSWDEVLELAKGLPEGLKIGLPLSPTHAICSFMSLCANVGGDDFFTDNGMEGSVAEQALSLLEELTRLSHPISLKQNPIHMLDVMSEQDEIAYIPLIFGYSNYSRSGFRKNAVCFTDIPSHGDLPNGAVIGGVGLAISRSCQHIQEAADFAMYVASEDCQRGLFFESGGQPGHRGAWTDSEVNRKSNGFFANTLQTLDHSFLRPRYDGYITFQETAGEMIHEYLESRGTQSPQRFIQSLNDLYLSSKKA